MTQSRQIAESIRINGKPPETGGELSPPGHPLAITGDPSSLTEPIPPPRVNEGDEVRLERPQAKTTTLAGFYNFEESLSPSLRHGINLLEEAIGILEQALEALEESDSMMAQDAVTRLRPVLMELFCCREVGDGFGEIVRACHTAALKLGDNTPSRDQVVALRWALHRLRKEPFISLKDAVIPVIDMDSSGLIVDEVSVTEIVPAADE